MIVPAPVDKHLADSEELLEVPEAPDALRALRHGELVEHLIADSVAGSASTAGLADETD